MKETMKISLQLSLPFYSSVFKSQFQHDYAEVNFRSVEFELTPTKFDQKSNLTLINIEWEQSELTFEMLSSYGTYKLVEKGIDFINFIIYHARTFDLETTNMVLVSPRTVNSAKLKIEVGTQEKIEEIKLSSEPPEFFKEYFQYINEPESVDMFYEMIQISDNETVQSLEINLLVDAYHAIYESRYSEAIINSLTAVEAHIFPILSKWLTEKFLHKNEKNTEKVLIDMSSSTKYELLFGSVAAKYLASEIKLLEDLKGINKMRNEIIHKGKRATKQEAYNCLNIASKFILILHFEIEPDTSY